MNDLDASLLIAALALYMAGGIVKGALGFGLPLVTISVMPFLVPVEQALAYNSVVLMATNLLQVWRAGEAGWALRAALPMLAATAVATPIGVWLATLLPAHILLAVLGGCVIAFSLLSLLSINPKLADTRRNALGVGAAGGIVGAFSSAPGPIFVMYLVTLDLPRARFMAMMGVLMGAVGLLLTTSFVARGVLDAERLALGAILVAPGFAGFVIGDRLAGRLPEAQFRRLVLGVLVVLGALMLRRAVFGD